MQNSLRRRSRDTNFAAARAHSMRNSLVAQAKSAFSPPHARALQMLTVPRFDRLPSDFATHLHRTKWPRTRHVCENEQHRQIRFLYGDAAATPILPQHNTTTCGIHLWNKQKAPFHNRACMRSRCPRYGPLTDCLPILTHATGA